MRKLPFIASVYRNKTHRGQKELSEEHELAKHKRLVRLIRRLAREVAWEVIDEHLEDYMHEEKSIDNIEGQ